MGEKKNIIMNLVELGKRNQKVTTKEINDALEEIGFVVELVHKLYESLDARRLDACRCSLRKRRSIWR